jgi:hypothetical protein|tara:strand:+ start:497 stop:1156 length:660 start_codon:yes stop_codon:yes gene_type:complete
MVLKDRNETLSVLFPRLNTVVGAGAVVIDPADGWQSLDSNGVYFESVIDLAGYSMERLTFAPFETTMQDPGLYLSQAGPGPGTAVRMMVMDLISDVPFSLADLSQVMTDFPARAPGMLGTNQDFTQIIYGNLRTYVSNNTLGLPGYYQLIDSSGFGSKSPTAASKLFCYKIINLSDGSAGDTLQVPASRIGLSGRMFAEDELPYMMRLKRSYELQQLVD